MRYIGIFIVRIPLVLLAFALGSSAVSAEQTVKIGICFTAVGPGDLSFNNMLYSGSIEVQGKYDVEFVYRTAASDTEEGFIQALQELIEQDQADLVLTLGFQARTALNAVAARYPDTRFALFDVVADPSDNVASVIYAQHEGAFLTGALVAYVSQTRKGGFIGGVDIDILEAYIQGFREGIDYVDPSVELLVEYCTLLPDFSGFNSPEKGYEIANRMYGDGADILFNASGASGPGIIQAALEHQKYVIGTDANQDYLAPGFVLTSLMKRLDVSMIDICEKFIRGEFQGNTTYEYGLENGGISLTPMEFTKEKISSEVRDHLQRITDRIISGEIVVTNTLVSDSK